MVKRNRNSDCFLLIVFAALVLACNLSRLRSSSSSSSSNNDRGSAAKTNSQPTAAFDPAGDPRKNLKDAFNKLKTAYPFRLTETITFTGNNTAMPPTVRVTEFAAADRIHTTLDGEEASITFGDKRYMYTNGKWVEAGQPPRFSQANMEKLVASSLKDVQPVGAETVNAVPCVAYIANFEWKMANQPSTAIAKTWIGLADGLPHQVDGDWKVANYQSKSHIIYEYNVDIKVEKPGP